MPLEYYQLKIAVLDTVKKTQGKRSMGSSLGIAVLVVAFVVLLWTFLWVARLMSHRDHRKKPRARIASENMPEDAPTVLAEEEPEHVHGRGYGANYGLLLGALSCALFFVTQTPLLLALTCVGFFYSGRALLRGLRYFRVVVWRALAGVILNLAALAMHVLFAMGQLPFPVLDVAAGLL